MGRELSTPVTVPLPTNMATQAPMMTQFLWQSANFTKFPGLDTSVMNNFHPIGSITEHICEATDAAWSTSAVVADGMSGDREYPFGTIKVLATVGEYHRAIPVDRPISRSRL